MYVPSTIKSTFGNSFSKNLGVWCLLITSAETAWKPRYFGVKIVSILSKVSLKCLQIVDRSGSKMQPAKSNEGLWRFIVRNWNTLSALDRKETFCCMHEVIERNFKKLGRNELSKFPFWMMLERSKTTSRSNPHIVLIFETFIVVKFCDRPFEKFFFVKVGNAKCKKKI